MNASPERVAADLVSLRLAAQVANAACAIDVRAVDEGALTRACRLLEKQKVSFIPIAARYGDAVEGTVLAAFVARDRARYDSERQEFERIRLAFARERIEAMVFKSTGAPPSFHYLSSNLDILVRQGARAPRVAF